MPWPETKGEHAGNRTAKTFWGQRKDNSLFGKPGVWKVLELVRGTPNSPPGVREITHLNVVGSRQPSGEEHRLPAGLGSILASAASQLSLQTGHSLIYKVARSRARDHVMSRM